MYWIGWLSSKGRGSLGVNLGRPIVTNDDILSSLCESDTLFPNYFGEDLLKSVHGACRGSSLSQQI